MGGFLSFCYRQLTVKPKPLPSNTSLKGKTALITGANSGLGLEAAKQLATHHVSRLILTVRDAEKGEAARTSILEKTPNTNVEIWTLDHEFYDSIVAFQQRVSTLDRLDYALLNAGVKKMEYSTAQTGHETNVQINHIGTSAVSFAVLRALRKTAHQLNAPTRLTIVSSEGHFWIPFHERKAETILERMDDKATFGHQMQRYYTTKLLNVLWTRNLASKVPAEEVVINTVNPGFCYSGLHRHESTGIIKIFLWAFGWTSAQGGHCLVDALVQHDGSHGKYLSDQKETAPSAFVLSEEGKTAETRIWDETIALLQKEVPGVNMSPFV
ncbi:short-chain dehydrogenase/reductase SDR [Periconia macrospinosa]|uniref:Short-chain dehydrogenase/reductase SDR n=1 Tax=Periconia macrospinosa TaxID=97972 RepID=A0A2V1DV03_9PLEO|nr:short-chain dehydrogenase/reductase SDR [Periconia macrospinosa]